MTDTMSVAVELENLVRAVDGVTAVYGSGPIAARVLTRVVDRVTGTTHTPRFVVVGDSPDGAMVSVSIGVADEEPASAVCRRVHDAIAAHLDSLDRTIAGITVRVSSIG